MNVYITNVPTYLIYTPLHANHSTDLIIGGEYYAVQISCMDANKVIMPGVRVQAAIVNAPDGSNVLLNDEMDSGTTDVYGISTIILTFTSGLSGIYEVQFSGNGFVNTTVLLLNVTNPVGSVTYVLSTIPTSVTVLESFSTSPFVSVLDVNGEPIQGKFVSVIVSNPRGVLVYDEIYEGEGIFIFESMMFVPPTVSGYYSLMFEVEGIYSEPTPWIFVTNPGDVNTEDLTTHQIQIYMLAIAVVSIPNFLGNSVHQPRWMIIVSLIGVSAVGLMGIGYPVAYWYVTAMPNNYGWIFTVESLILSFVSLMVVFSFLGVLWSTCAECCCNRGKKKVEKHHYAKKIRKYRQWVKSQLPLGSKRYYAKVAQDEINKERHERNRILREEESKRKREFEHSEYIRRSKLGFFSWFKEGLVEWLTFCKRDLFHSLHLSRKHEQITEEEEIEHDRQVSFEKHIKNSEQAFFYPQRLWIGFLVGTYLAITVAVLCLLATWYLVYYLALLEEKIVGPVQRLEDALAVLGNFTTSLSEANTNISFILDPLISAGQLPSNAASKFSTIIDTIQQIIQLANIIPSPEGVTRILERMRYVIWYSGYVAVGCSIFVAFVLHFFVFSKYKRTILELRLGHYPFDRTHYPALSAANYIGLKTIHAGMGQFFIFSFFFWISCAFQPETFKFLWVHVVLIVKAIAYAVAAKTIAKFIVAHYLVNHQAIIHRRLWSFFDNAWIFVNLISISAISFLRLLISLILSVLRFTRMDSSLAEVKKAHIDMGYAAHISMAYLDHTNNNPVLQVFTHLLTKEMKATRLERKVKLVKKATTFSFDGKSVKTPLLLAAEDENAKNSTHYYPAKRRNQIIFRWWLFVTLHNNPSIRNTRKRYSRNRRSRDENGNFDYEEIGSDSDTKILISNAKAP
eukprot:TRINITY_DN1383_c0_g1_i7.p1 TRINITY_DN1383_c0_g1~~TRINITY_DN1383_c0_g1_i7.p1  ORF type:complete len:966 (+),score=162.26 TRINITY_DN1383_c0_g1_i7:178-2898(+)